MTTTVTESSTHQQRKDPPASSSKTTTTLTTNKIKSKYGDRKKIPPNEENDTPARYINGFPEYEKKFGNGVVMFWCEICHRYTCTHSTGSHVGKSGDEKKTKKKDHNDDDKKEGENDKSVVCSITAKSDSNEKPVKKNAKQAKRGRYKKKFFKQKE